jgi:hypothetical protein
MSRKRAWARYVKDAAQNNRRARMQFTKRHQYAPDFDQPKTHSEKVYVRKLKEHDPRFVEITDKVAARNFIDRQLGAGQSDALCVPVLAQADNFDALQDDVWDQDVIVKCTHGSGMNVTVPKGDIAARANARRLTRKWLGQVHGGSRFEWAYFDLKPSVIAEPVIPGISDVKFYCYDGVPTFGMCEENGHNNPLIGIYTAEWTPVDMTFVTFGPLRTPPPAHLAEMLEVSTKLSQGFDSIRVDFLVTPDRFYLGELTVYDGSGLGRFDTKENDAIFGKPWKQQRFGYSA